MERASVRHARRRADTVFPIIAICAADAMAENVNKLDSAPMCPISNIGGACGGGAHRISALGRPFPGEAEPAGGLFFVQADLAYLKDGPRRGVLLG
jgi:hypothetical protein